MNPEIPIAIAAALLSLIAAPRWLTWIAPLARRKMLAIAVAAVAPLILRAALLPWFPAPQPRVNDEFTTLLVADTLAQGRLANPQHPFWFHFESPHILQRPAYVSAFWLGPGAVMAFGKNLFGHEWAGVWMSVAFMCGAICWMLQGWSPPVWALTGALLAGLRFGVSNYWMNSYWGGALAAGAGALVLGAMPRLIRSPHWRRAIPMGIGLAILANSRPFEGAVLGTAATAALCFTMFRRHGFETTLRAAILPIAAIVGATGLWMTYTFARVMGKPWIVPYVYYRETRSVAPHFLWQSPRPIPKFNSRELRRFYAEWEMKDYIEARADGMGGIARKLAGYFRFYFGPLFIVPLLASFWSRRVRIPAMIGAVFVLLALGPQVWHSQHYASPATGLAMLFVAQGMRVLAAWRPIGMRFAQGIPIACLAMLACQAIAKPQGPEAPRGWRWPSSAGESRAAVVRQIRAAGGKHLVFVRYSDSHEVGDEWVYNDAKIDASPIVWARELDSESNSHLMRYFAERKVWLVEPDGSRVQNYLEAPPRLMPFVAVGAPGIASIRSIEEVRRRMLAIVGNPVARNCEIWNRLFSRATGIAAPQSSCNGEIAFDDWLNWLEHQTL